MRGNTGVKKSRGNLEQEKSEIDATAIPSMKGLQIDDRLNYVCNSLKLEELVTAQHILRYFRNS